FVENRYIEYENASIPNSLVKLLFGDQIKKIISVLYKNRQKSFVLDLYEFDKMFENRDSNLRNFFTKICNILISYDHSAYNRNKNNKKVIIILHLIAELHNKYINNFKLELALYLTRSGTIYDTIDIL
ncbi:1952_t:CDS:1, partial [Scutellospora calospora]